MTEEQLQRLTARIQADQEIKVRVIKRLQRDAWFFCENFVWTLDEHDLLNPIKRLPDKAYLKAITNIWSKEQLVLIEKSRQMMISWLMAALHYWLAAYHSGQNVLVQSKKEDDSDLILKRMEFIHNHIPEDLRVPLAGGKKTYCNIEFDGTHSRILGVSQNPEASRSQTASAIFSDETAFQDRAEEAYRAVRPALGQTGKYTAVSTPNGKEFFWKLRSDLC